MTWLKLAKWGVPALLVAFMTWAMIDRFALADAVDRFKQCEKAAGMPREQLGYCPPHIWSQIEAARQGAACEAALGKRDLYAIRMTCGAQAKRIDAELTAATANLAAARQDLQTERASRADAIARAEQRAKAQANRTADNDRTIRDAPRGADGRVHCDAECVRRLAGDREAQR